MRHRRTTTLLLALLLTALTPLRGYAVVMHCALAEGPDMGLAAQDAHPSHCEHSTPVAHPHPCSDCCSTAAPALTAGRYELPEAQAAVISPRLIWPPPTLNLDRLDRPPRLH